jgi:hypothetical protein
MYATLETYDLHDEKCPHYRGGGCGGGVVREGFEVRPKLKLTTDTPEARRKRRSGKGIDGCRPYDPYNPYRFMFDSRYNPFPYDPDYKVDDNGRHLNIYSYPSSDSTTRVLYCDAPPHMWEFCDDDA